MWTCEKCGVKNPGDVYSCRICGAQPPSSAGLHTRQLPPLPPPATCLKCGAQDIMHSSRVLTYGAYSGELEIEVASRAARNVMLRQRVRAKVCAECGFTEFYTDNPDMLWDTYEARS